MTDPLNPGAVRATDILKDDNVDLASQSKDDQRPWWLRLVTTLRPTASVERDKKSGKLIETIGVKGHVDL